MMQKSVLIISSEAGGRDTMATLLTDSGLRVSLAATGAEAIKIFSNSPPDFILCEQFLPDSSGVELKRRLLRLSPKSRVIVLSSFTIIRTSDDVLRFGPSDFILDQRELLDLLDAAGEDRAPGAVPVTDEHPKKWFIGNIDV